MIRTLAMIAVAGFLLSVVCLSVAIRLAGPEFVANGAWNWNPGSAWEWQWHDGHHHMRHEAGASRDLAWSGGEALQLDVPADVRFTQSDGPAKVTLMGPRDVIDNIVLENGRIRSARGMHMGFDEDRVRIEISAPRITRFDAHGSNRIDIQNYRQDRLELHVSGEAAVTARGTAKSVDLAISGSGDADLGELKAEAAEVDISGSGHAKVRPTDSAKLRISGSGDVELLGHPRHLESQVSGSGHIEQDDGEATPPEEQPTPPAKPVQPAKAI